MNDLPPEDKSWTPGASLGAKAEAVASGRAAAPETVRMNDLPPEDKSWTPGASLGAEAEAVASGRAAPNPLAPPPWEPGHLAPVYVAASQARTEGMSWDEINQQIYEARSNALKAGMSGEEIDKRFGLSSDPEKTQAPPGMERLHLWPAPSDEYRALARDLAPHFQPGEWPEMHSAGDFASALGWHLMDIVKVFGQASANGMAAIQELGEGGQYLSKADRIRLSIEAQGFLGNFGSGGISARGAAFRAGRPVPGSGGIEGRPVPGSGAPEKGLPPMTDVLDAATVIARDHPQGLAPGPLTGAARAVGETFAATGEHPIDLAQRAKDDPAVMAALHDHVDAPAGETVPVRPPEPADPSMMSGPLTPEQHLAESIAAVQEPGLIPDADGARAAVYVPGSAGSSPPPGTGVPVPRPSPSPLINPETIGQPNPVLAEGLVTALRRIFDVQSLLREGAGVIRHRLADLQANRIRSTENLRRFGRAVGDMSSAERREWWHAFEGGDSAIADAALPGDAGLLARTRGMLRVAGVPENVGARVEDIPSRPGVRVMGYYDPATREIVLNRGVDHTTAAHEVFHALFDPASKLLTDDQRAVIEARAKRWLRERLPPDPANPHAPATNQEMLERLGYPPSQWFEEAGARLIGESSRVVNARDALARWEGTTLGRMGHEIRAEMDRRWLEMDRLGLAPNYIDGYLPRLYQDPRAAAAVFGRRPMEGTKTFTRQRAFEFMRDAEAAGLKLASDNPVETALIRLHDMDRLITAHEIMGELETRGLGDWIPHGTRVPPGLSRINDRVAERQGGAFYAPDPVAIMLNRHLQPGWNGNPVYDALRSATSAATTLKLATSAFHPIYMAWDAMAGEAALGLTQASRGGVLNLARGAATVLRSPIAPVLNFVEGLRVSHFAATGEGPPRMTMLYDAMLASGARVGRAPQYTSSAMGGFFDSMAASVSNSGRLTFGQDVSAMFRNAPPMFIGATRIAPGYVRAMLQIVPRVLDTLTEPIMGKLVPYMKAGALSRELQDMLVAHPGMGLDDIREFGGRISDRIDNRIGEVVQDNLFWPTVLHNINNIVFMAPQWFMGKLRLLGGTATDLAALGTETAPLGGRQLSGNVAYLLGGGVIATMFTGAIYGALKGTWRPDWTLHDYFVPPNGGTDRQGGDDFIMLPDIWRDAYGWTTDPQHEATNKVNSLWPLLKQIATNRQYDGAVITDPASNWREAAGDYTAFTLRQLGPMMWSQDVPDAANISTLERWLGIREAPFGLREPERAEAHGQKELRRALRQKARDDARKDE